VPGSYEPASKREVKYPKDVYFAAMPVQECIAATIDRCDQYTNEMIRTGRHSLYKNAHVHYLQGYASRGFISNTGALGELSSIWVNHYRNIISHSINLVCSERLSWEPQIAGDNNWNAMELIRNARNVLDYYSNRTDMDLDGKLRQAVEKFAVFGDSWITVLWDDMAGRTVASQDGWDVKEGDVDVKVWTPFDIYLDVAMSDINQCQWIVLRETVNKFDECARYPEWADKIKDLSETFNTYRKEMVSYSGEVVDLIYKWRLIHKRTPACPEGRELVFITDDIVLEDGPLDYDEWPVIRLAAGEAWGTPFGYSKFFDNLPLQDAVDRLTSSDLTNQLTFAIHNVLIPMDGHLNHTTLYGGLHVIKYDAAKGELYKPSTLNLNAPQPHLQNSIDKYITNMGTIGGVNEAVKGNADTVIKGQASGAALALLTTNAINFNSDIQKTWVHGGEELGTKIIKTLARKAKTTRSATMKVGASSKSFKFTGPSLEGITNVIVKIGSPLLQSDAGKLTVVESLIQANVGITKEQVIGIIEGQPLSSILEDEESELMLIQDENERMMRGEQVPPAAVDENHVLHIKRHKAQRSSVAIKQNAQVMQAFLAHEQTHIEQLTGNAKHGPMNPVLAGLLGQPVIPPGSAPGTLETGPAGPKPPTPPTPPAPGTPPGVPNKAPQAPGAPQPAIKPPQMPPSPAATLPKLGA
jgi:hypothetical protein